MLSKSQADIAEEVGEAHVPDSVVQVTRNPLSYDVASFLRLRKALVIIYVGDIYQRFFVDCASHILARDKHLSR